MSVVEVAHHLQNGPSGAFLGCKAAAQLGDGLCVGLESSNDSGDLFVDPQLAITADDLPVMTGRNGHWRGAPASPHCRLVRLDAQQPGDLVGGGALAGESEVDVLSQRHPWRLPGRWPRRSEERRVGKECRSRWS